jgi:hypothetical protein
MYTGYEIKVSRADFLGDNKWPSYLPYCEYFYFVSPQGLIQPEEVSAEVGLMWVTKNGSRLYTKKKAPYRTIELPAKIFIYLLMWRQDKVTKKNLDYWKEWLETRDEEKEVGCRVSRKLQKLYSDNVVKVQRKQKWLEEEISRYKDLKEFLVKNNLHVNSWNIETKVQGILEGNLPSDLLFKLKTLYASLGTLIEKEEDEIVNRRKPSGV